MEIRLHPDIEVFVHEQIREGAYQSAEEVLTEALFFLWQQNEGAAQPAQSGLSGQALARRTPDGG